MDETYNVCSRCSSGSKAGRESEKYSIVVAKTGDPSFLENNSKIAGPCRPLAEICN